MNPSFKFVFGKPAGDCVGRWIMGSVMETPAGYRFTADLILSYAMPSDWMLHRVWLDVDRAFDARDFAAYLRLLSTGKFKTGSRVLSVHETEGLDPVSVSTICEAVTAYRDPQAREILPWPEGLVSLRDQLEQVKKKEMISRAVAGSRRRRPSLPKEQPTRP